MRSLACGQPETVRLLGLAVLLTAAMVLAGCKGEQAGSRGNVGHVAAFPVRVATAEAHDIHVYLTSLGTVTPLETATVRSRVDGQLMSVHFTEGQEVKSGDLLAQIDPRPFQAQLEQAQGQLARDQALLGSARVDLRRYRALLAEDSIAEQQVATQASLVKQYEGTLKLDQAQVDNAKLQLDYTHITAPISGRLGLRLVDPGNIVHASDTTGLVVIKRVRPMSVVFPLPQDDLPRVLGLLGAGASVPVDAFGRDEATLLAAGRLTAVDNQIDTATGTAKLRAEFPNENRRLFPNQFVNVRLLLDTLHGVTTVPSSAVQMGTKGAYVFVVKSDNKVALRSIEPGPSDGGLTSVRSGLEPGERVVTDGIDRLRDGAKVVPSARDDGQGHPSKARPSPAGPPEHH
jgi:multidrug efflux system membrane fusion protein